MTEDGRMDAVDRLTVGLIRSLNRSVVRDEDPDGLLLANFGQAAQPLAEALLAVIREEVAAALDESRLPRRQSP